MNPAGKYGIVALAIWVALFVPLVTAFHHHDTHASAVVVPNLPSPSSTGADFPSCEVCLRLAAPVESIEDRDPIVLSTTRVSLRPCNDLTPQLRPASSIGVRAPPYSFS